MSAAYGSPALMTQLSNQSGDLIASSGIVAFKGDVKMDARSK